MTQRQRMSCPSLSSLHHGVVCRKAPCTTGKENILEVVINRVCNDKIMPCTFPTSHLRLGQIRAGILKKVRDSFFFRLISLTTNFLLKSTCELSKRVPESG